MAINYVHPSVSSTITDNSTVYVTASGTTKLFAVFTSEKGIDNKIQTITSVSEFIFNYGEPNMKLYGQAAYNIVNWLNAGGVAYCLRVLPKDAGYANAIVNIQTRVSNKIVLDRDGNEVEIENGSVELRPCITYETVNNRSETDINTISLKDSTSDGRTTIDGFKDNMIFAVLPKGRGKGFNNLGFKIYLTDSYDSTYEFRLYNFEVTKTSETGGTSTIQGPFLVSLDPDAMSNSGSSLFIVDVIDRYCDYFKIIFSEKNYEALAKTINPYVHPNKIDFFTGISRVVNYESETYDDSNTRKEEDVHMRVSIIDNDVTEQEIVDYDNRFRTSEYNHYENSLERIKKALSIIRSKGNVDKFKNIEVESFNNEKTLEAAINTLAELDIASLYEDFDKINNSLDFEDASTVINDLTNKINKLIDQLYEIYDYSTIGKVDNGDNGTVLTNLSKIEADLKRKDVAIVTCNKYRNVISNLLEKYDSLNISSTNSEKEEFIKEFIDELEVVLEGLKGIADKDTMFADTGLANIETVLNTINNDYELITDELGLITNSEYLAILDKDNDDSSWNKIKTLLTTENSVPSTIDYVLLEKYISIYSGIKGSLSTVKSLVINLINLTINNFSEINYEDAEKATINVKDNKETKSRNIYTTILKNYDANSYISLEGGTDGSIEEIPFYNKEVEKLIMQGYKGGIDKTLIDKDQWPIDMVLDANYSANIKNAIATLCTEYRDDFMGILDTEFQGSPSEAIEYRKNSIGVNNFRLAIFTQDFVIEDTEYTGNNIQVTPTYFLASKIPANDNNSGIHWNFVGPRRGTISGYKSISFLPNPNERENLYNAQVNYVQQDQTSTRFGSQLTSQTTVSALSNISCVRTLLRIQRDVEDLMKNYQFEFNDSVTITNAQTALNSYLSQWLSNRACDTINGTVYASNYDRQQKLLRVKVELVFNSIIERIAIDLIVNA